MMRSRALGLCVAVLLFAPGARAHVELLSPAPRSTELKDGPCGRGPTDSGGCALPGTRAPSPATPALLLVALGALIFGHRRHSRSR